MVAVWTDTTTHQCAADSAAFSSCACTPASVLHMWGIAVAMSFSIIAIVIGMLCVLALSVLVPVVVYAVIALLAVIVAVISVRILVVCRPSHIRRLRGT